MNRDAIRCPTVDRDLSCNRCGYNLRGLDSGSVCPECGFEIWETVWTARLEPAWFGALSRGALLIGLAIAIDGIGVLYTRNALHLIHPIATLVGAFGAWMFFSPHPLKSQRRTLLTTFGRVVCVVAATLHLQAWLAFAPITGPVRAAFPLPAGRPPFLCAVLLVWSLEAALVFGRAAAIARRIGDRAGAVQANLLAIVTCASLGLWTYVVAIIRIAAGEWVLLITGATLLTLCAIWSLVFFAFFSMILRKRANKAGVNDAAGVALA